MSRIVVGVAGGIAAYKAVDLVRRLSEATHQVTVVPTAAALRFVGEPTWAAISGRPVVTDLWSSADLVSHVRLGQDSDLVLIAPATADLLARACHGIASDQLTNVLLTVQCPVLFAPAMHTEMWQHPATQANVETLRSRGSIVIEPGYGRLTGKDSGPGRLPEPAALAELAEEVLRVGPGRARIDMAGMNVVVSAGGTREPWDAVRFLGNRSSGRQGFALARNAIARGARVTLVLGTTDEDPPAGCAVVRVETAEEMRNAMHATVSVEEPDAIIMAAAVADFRPARTVANKITKESLDKQPDGSAVPELALERTVDVLAELVERRGSASRPIMVGFAAETPGPYETLVDRALDKVNRKGCDLIVANAVTNGSVFGESTTSVSIVNPSGIIDEAVDVDKGHAASRIWDSVVQMFSQGAASRSAPETGLKAR